VVEGRGDPAKGRSLVAQLLNRRQDPCSAGSGSRCCPSRTGLHGKSRSLPILESFLSGALTRERLVSSRSVCVSAFDRKY